MKITSDTDSTVRRPVKAVVAYIGADGPVLLKLRRGDTLVCDASDIAVRAGMTSAAALRTFVNRGVVLYSIEGLHAKVVLGSRWAWVGSANASASSRDDLLEASVRVTDSATIRRLRTWVEGLVTEDAVLSRRDVDKLLELPVKRRTGLPHRRRLPTELPDDPQRLWLAVTDLYASKAVERAADRERDEIRHAKRRRGITGRLTWFEWEYGSCQFSEGGWIIRVAKGHPSRPAQVVRVSNPRAGSYIVWTAEVPTVRRPRKAELLQACGLRPETLAEAGFFKVPPSRRKSVIDLYR